MGTQKTKAYLEVEFPGRKPWLIDEIKEFSYSSDMMAVGDQCSFTVVADDKGDTLRKLPVGALLRLRLNNPAVNRGRWTLKHLGRIITRDASLSDGTIKVVSADLGWHLTSCHAPLYKRFRGLKLDQIVNPATGFIDPSFGFMGVRADGNALNRSLKQGRALIQAQQMKVLDTLQVVQVEPGQSFYDCITTYAARENLLVGVSVDGFIQLWNPDYDRAPLYSFEVSAQRSNVSEARRHDEAGSRYSEVVCVGEALALGVQMNDPNDPNATKRRGSYKAPINPATGLPSVMPFTHRHTFADGEMLDGQMAAADAEWKWKRGLFDSHYLEVKVPDHFQGSEWLESDHLCDVRFPGLSAEGRYYVQSARCDSTVKDGDTTTLILRWPYLLSAAYGVWGSRPKLSDPADTLALLPGIGDGQ